MVLFTISSCHLAILLALVSYTLALPVSQSPSVSSTPSRLKYLRPQRKFCVSWLHGAKPSQSTSTITEGSLLWATSTLSETDIISKALEKTVTFETSITLEVVSTVTAPLQQNTQSSLPPSSTSTASNIRRAERLKKLPHFTDEEITEACLVLIYGRSHYDPTTTVKILRVTSTLLSTEMTQSTSLIPITQSVIATSTSIRNVIETVAPSATVALQSAQQTGILLATRVVPITLTMTETATEYATVTSTRTATQTQVANEYITQLLTMSSTQIIPTTAVQTAFSTVFSIDVVPTTIVQFKPTTIIESKPTTITETLSTIISKTDVSTSTQVIKTTATVQSIQSETATQTLTDTTKVTATAMSTLSEIEISTLTNSLTIYTTTTNTVTSTVLAVVTEIATVSLTSTSEINATPTAISVDSTSITTSNLPSATHPPVEPLKVADAAGQICVLNDNTYTCTYTPADQHNGLVSSFTSPCTGELKIQLDGGHGGNNMNNGGYAPGLSVSSQIKYGPEKSTTIPANTIYDIYVGGNGNSAYYQQNSEGGFNGGGTGDADSDASGGGGATDIRYQGQRLAIAAGGGGNGYSEGTDGYGNAQVPTLYVDDFTGKGQDTTYWGAGAGGGGYQGGQEGMYEGEGGYTGSNLGDIDLGVALGSPQAIVTFTCTI